MGCTTAHAPGRTATTAIAVQSVAPQPREDLLLDDAAAFHETVFRRRPLP